MKAPWTCLPPVNSHSHPRARGMDTHRLSIILSHEVPEKENFSQQVSYWSVTRSIPVCQRCAASIALRAHKAQSVSTVRKNRSATHGPKILTGLHQIWLHCTKIPPCCLLPFNFASLFAQKELCCVHNCSPLHTNVRTSFFDPFLTH